MNIQLLTFIGPPITTLAPMLKHYADLGVPSFLLYVHEEEGRKSIVEEVSRSAAAYPGARVMPITGDWLTLQVKILEKMQEEPNEWFVLADHDEFQLYPRDLVGILEEADRRGFDYVCGCYVDRVAEDGTLKPLDPDQPLFEQYPLGAFLSFPVCRANCAKVVVCKGRVRFSNPGHHRPVNGTPFPIKELLAEVHHFKWVGGLIENLMSQSSPGSPFGDMLQQEDIRFVQYFRSHGDRIPLDDPGLVVGRCNPHHPDWETIKSYSILFDTMSRNDALLSVAPVLDELIDTLKPQTEMFVSPSREHYCRFPLEVFPGDQDGLRLLSTELKEVFELDRQNADLLLGTTGFKTLQEHAAEYANRLRRMMPSAPGPIFQEALRVALSEFARAGLFISDRQWLEALRARDCPSTEPIPSVTTIGIVTKDRPQHLNRGLRTLLCQLEATGRQARISIYDDSETDGTLEAVRSVAKELTVPGVTLTYSGHKQKELHLKKLIASRRVCPDILQFALKQDYGGLSAYGRNLNWLLLDNLGSLVISLDDDILFQPAPAPDQVEGLAISSSAAPAEFRFYRSRVDALASLRLSAADGIALTETLLGRQVADCVRSFGGLTSLDSISAPLMRGLMHNGGKVVVTMFGIAGDAGSSQDWYALVGRSRERLRNASEGEPSLLESHEVVKAASCFTVTDTPAFMTYACGLDNRAPLPPFLPVGRNSDGVFAAILRRCFTNCYYGHLPWVLPHDPPIRMWQADNYVKPRVAEILLEAIVSTEFEANGYGATENVELLGRLLKSIGQLPTRDFETWIRRRYCGFLVTRLKTAEAALDEDPISAGKWRDYCLGHIKKLRATISDVEHVGGADLEPVLGASETMTATQSLIKRYGELLTCWSEIGQASTQIASSHGPIAKRVSTKQVISVAFSRYSGN